VPGSTRAADVGLPVWGLHAPWLGLAAAVPLGLLSGLAAALAPVRAISRLDALAAVRSADAPAPAARFPWPGIAVLGTAPCRAWPRGERFKLLPYYQQIVEAGVVSGEVFSGVWKNVTTAADIDFLDAAQAALN